MTFLRLILAGIAGAALSLLFWHCRSHPNAFTTYDDYPIYEGDDLGVSYHPDHTDFKIWAPTAEAVRLHLYAAGTGGTSQATLDMRRAGKGLWTHRAAGDLHGTYYTFQVQIEGKWLEEVPDIRARAVGLNGRRGMVVDLDRTDPEGWEEDRRPPLRSFQDIVIYELHVRDATIHPSSGAEHPGTFLGLAQRGTRSPAGLATGLDHLVEMGVTHVHLLPVFDFRSIDEAETEDPAFNWGYDPQNYNVPEGSYSTDPADGATRILEFKQLVQALHRAGIRVIMDVVYNHTGATEGSNFNQLVPGYYYRHNPDGSWSDAAACGNETASERAMMRKFMLESVAYWASEYHIDGFRFDLMGIHDLETMNRIAATLRRIDPSIFIYGEGWTAGDSPLPDSLRALKRNTPYLDGVAAFSDDVRDGLKGHVFHPERPGFVSGALGLKESVKFGVVAATRHPQVDYAAVNYSDQPWAPEPAQCITYVSCHDNHTLWDRLHESRPEASEADRIRMHRLALFGVLTAQGVSFLHAGTEMLRTKQGVENSYNAPDSINQIDWTRKHQYRDVVEWVRRMIALRKQHPAFRMPSAAMIRSNLQFLALEDEQLLAYTIDGRAAGDGWSSLLVAMNGSGVSKRLELPAGTWTVAVSGDRIDPNGIRTVGDGNLSLAPYTGVILFQ